MCGERYIYAFDTKRTTIRDIFTPWVNMLYQKLQSLYVALTWTDDTFKTGDAYVLLIW
jgi:hypothetical protein